MERYAKEVEELDTEIGHINDAIQDVKSKNEDITGRYDMRQDDIDEYREEQRILEEQRQFEEKQCNSAIRLQVEIFWFHIGQYFCMMLLIIKFLFISVMVAWCDG